AIETARIEVRELEARKKSLENDIASAEEKMGKYKTQQMQVRKNDEYQALGHEIVTMQTAIGGFEEEELKVMYSLDDAKRRFAAAEAEMKQNIVAHEARLKTLHTRESSLKAELEGQKAEVSQARTGIDDPSIRLYDRLSGLAATGKIRFPICVPLHDQKCGGCHLKISSGIETDLRKGENLTTCDQCGRILFWQV
ncbi:MAG TPA: C4-type zinc ribbon domain-containing protein, partial [Opitutaceae bacterium]|nr:C4-type zinc ribbon domain-containing protein [Opitutaceae bacterium]